MSTPSSRSHPRSEVRADGGSHGFSIRNTCEAPAPIALSLIARRSTWVEPYGTQITMRGLGRNHWLSWIFLMKYLSICSVIVKSAITPSFIGRMAVMLPGVRPSICLAARPTAWMVFLPLGPPFLADRDHRKARRGRCLCRARRSVCWRSEVDREVGGKYLETKENILIRMEFLRLAFPRERGFYNSPKSR
jgi:hypothetical protein